MSSELILLLHPDEATRGRLSAALHESGFKVLTAADEGSALGHLAQMRFVLPDASRCSRPSRRGHSECTYPTLGDTSERCCSYARE